MSYYSSVILADTPYRYYRLNDVNGSLGHPTDSSVNAVNGNNYIGGPVFQAAGLLARETDTSAYLPNNNTDYIRIQADGTGFILGGQTNFSIECWIAGRATGVAQLALYAEYDSTALDYLAFQSTTSANTQLTFTYKGHLSAFAQVNSASGLTLSDGKPHHLVVTKSGTSVIIYVDGVQSGSTGTVNADNTFDLGGASRVRSGNWFDSAAYGLGGYRIDELALYTSVLTSTQVANHFTAGTVPTYANIITGDSPNIYYRLDDLSGTTTTATVGPNAAYRNSPTLGVTGAIANDSNKAVTLARASAQDVALASHSTAQDIGNVFTVEAWVKRASTGGYHYIFHNGAGSIGYRIDTTTNFLHLDRTTVASIVSSTIPLTDLTKWHHVVVTKNLSTTKLYLDSEDVTGTVTDSVFVSPGQPFAIGSDGSANYFDGSMDEFALYPNSLTPSQVSNHYLIGIPSSTYTTAVLSDSPTLYWRLGEATGPTANDNSGNFQSGTYINSPTRGTAGLISADSNTAVTFVRASTQSITAPSTFSTNLADSFTYEAWIKRTNLTSQINSIMSKGNGGGYIRLETDGKLSLIKSQFASIVQSTVAITDTTTAHHVVATKNGATVKLYIDGVDVTGTVTNATCGLTAQVFRVGADTDAGTNPQEHADLIIDEVATYATALSAARVAAHFSAASPTIPTNVTPPVISGSIIAPTTLTSTPGTWTG